MSEFIPKKGPMLAHNYEQHVLRFPCYAQPKLDGVRAVYFKGYLYSRRGHKYSRIALPHIYDALAHLALDNVLLDGELYIHGRLLQDINAIATCVRNIRHQDYAKVEYHLFDCFSIEHPNLPFDKRYSLLCDKVHGCPSCIQFVETHEILDQTHANNIYREFVIRGYEGIMYRQLPNTYMFSRSHQLLKRKKFDTCRARVVDFFEGEGKYVGMLGGVIVKAIINDVETTFNIGSGFDDNQRRIFWNDKCLIIGKTLLIQYQRLNKSGIPQAATLDKVLY